MALTLEEYSKDASRTIPEATVNDKLVMSALGLTGEAGEFGEMVKKHIFHYHDFDRAKAAKELGDILWYVNAGAKAIGYTLEEIAEMNIAKLRARYPDGFTSEDSKRRVDEAADKLLDTAYDDLVYGKE